MWYEQSWYNAGSWYSQTWFSEPAGGGGGGVPSWFNQDWFNGGLWFDDSWFMPPSGVVAGGGTAIVRISSVRARVDVKISRDRGTGTSSAAGPVTVTFNKDFADIISLDAFPVSNSSQKIFRVINFVDSPDPTSFTLEFYNDSGTRLALDFGWMAEGVVKVS